MEMPEIGDDTIEKLHNVDLLDFSGDTPTETINEPEELPVPEEKGLTYGEDYVDTFEGERQLVEKSPAISTEKISHDENLDDVESQLIDPDEAEVKHQNVHDLLVKKRDYQNVKKKE